MNEKDIERIKKMNERWGQRGPEWHERKRKNNRRINGTLSSQYAYQNQWVGKQYKSVRG